MVEENIENVDELDLIFETNARLYALVELLIEKGIISGEEYEKKLEQVIEENLAEEEDEE